MTCVKSLQFPVPYCPELHFSEFSSALADMKNSVQVCSAGVVGARVKCRVFYQGG